jgi:hypothetical protein
MGDVLMLRRLLAAALVAAGLVAVGDLPAQACPASPPGLEQQTMAADDVFTGSVTDRQREGRTVLYTVAVDRVYKGDLDATDATLRTSALPRACGSPGLRPDGDYVFFTRGDAMRIGADSGTAGATHARVTRVERLLGDGRPAAEPAPEQASFTLVGGERTSLERVAAPGAALVLVGLLGLLAAALMGRRRA